MPAQTSPGSRTTSTSTSSSDVHIASSNATVNAFLGTRKPKPSWMDGGVTGAISRPLGPRQPPPRAISKQPVQTQTVLPSPAPSDEPSPAVSNALDSPNPPPASLTEMQAMGSSGNSGSVGAPVTEARIDHDLTAATPTPNGQESFRPGYSGTPIRSNGHLQPPSIISPQFTTAGQPGAVLASPRVSTIQSALPATSANNATMGVPQTRPKQSPRVSEAPLVTGNNRAHQAKRRRTDPTQPKQFKYSSLMSSIDFYILSCGGDKAFSTDIERPRMQLIREACTREDGFFLALHQLFCMWSNSPAQVYQLLPIAPEIINSAFAIVETVLKKNQAVTGSHRNWFAQFPAEINTLLQSPATTYASSVEQVSNFLFNLTEHFNTLTEKSLRRRYPYLVDELLFYLGCYSPVLQIIFFTASRRRLGVLDSPLGLQIETAFRNDQQSHINQATGFQVLTPIASGGEIERRNSELINYYKFIVGQAQAQAQANSQLQPNSTPVSGSPAANSPRAQNLLRRSVSGNVSIAPQPGNTKRDSNSPSTPFSPIFPGQVPSGQSQTQPNSPMMTSPAPTGGQVPSQFILPSNNLIAQPQASSYTLSEEQMMRYRLQQKQQQQQLAGQFNQIAGHSGMQLQHQQPPQQPLQHPQFAQFQQQLYVQAQQMNQPNTGPTPNMVFGQANFMNMPPAQQQTHARLQVQAPQHGVGLPSLLIPQSGNMSPGSVVSNGISPGARQPGRAMQQSMQQNASHRRLPGQGNTLLLPAKGYHIPRPEIPYEPNEKKAVMMSLHQVQARSPKRVIKRAETERYYQAAKSFPVPPTFVVPNSSIHQFFFTVTEEQYAATSRSVKKGGNLLPVSEHFNGSLRWRIRCCKAPTADKPLTEEQWSALDMNWPTNIFMTFNGRPLDIRRQSHNGKDLAIELTDMVSLGTNVLQVVLPDLKKETSNGRFLAVEMLETLSHSNVVAMVWERGMMTEAETLEIIKKRLGGSAGDDEVSVLDPELSIGLADPFSAVIFKIPVRGSECTHMECFDLENWLDTRPSKSPVKCHHQYIQCDCPTSPEPTNPDKWRCPICMQDARPYSLRIDGFLLKVRSELEKQDKLHTKSLKVSADGRWEVVLEENDDSGDSDDDGGPPVKKRSAPPIFKKPSVPSTARRQDVEVIEIDDD